MDIELVREIARLETTRAIFFYKLAEAVEKNAISKSDLIELVREQGQEAERSAARLQEAYHG